MILDAISLVAYLFPREGRRNQARAAGGMVIVRVEEHNSLEKAPFGSN